MFDDDAIWAEIFVLPYVPGIRTSPSSSRPTTAASPATSWRPRHRGVRAAGSPTNGGRARRPLAATRSRAHAAGRHTDLRVLAAAARPSRTATPIPRICTSTCCPNCRAGAGATPDRDAHRALARPRRFRSAPGRIRGERRSGRLLSARRLHRPPSHPGVQAFGARCCRQRPRTLAAGRSLRGWTISPRRPDAKRRCAPCRATDGTAPRALVLGRHRLPRRAARAAAAERPATGCGVLARDARRVAAFDWGRRVEVVEGDATDPVGRRRSGRATSTCSTTSSTRWARARASRDADRRAAARPSPRPRPRHPSDASCTSAGCIRTTPSCRRTCARASRWADPARQRGAHARAAGRRRDRVGLGVVRDGAPPHRGAAVHAGTEVGAQPHPADRGARRAALPARRRPRGRRT